MIDRNELYSFTDFLAICGGLLGIFLDISILSTIEFIFYATIRLFWRMRLPSKLAPNVVDIEPNRKEIDRVDDVEVISVDSISTNEDVCSRNE